MSEINATQRKNAELAREYLEWQRYKRNRFRETMFIYTEVIEKLLRWIGDAPLATVTVNALEAFVTLRPLRCEPVAKLGMRCEEQLLRCDAPLFLCQAREGADERTPEVKLRERQLKGDVVWVSE